jgi:hypothetical protein
MPPGTKVVVHEKPHQRGSWDPHGKMGWYLGPALEHYRCHRCHITNTNSERISDTVEFFPHTDSLPKLSLQEATVIAAEALTEALQRKQPPPNLKTLLDPTKAALSQLQQYIHPPTPSEATTAELPRVRELPRVMNTKEQAPTPSSQEGPIASRTRSGGNRVEQQNFYANTVIHPTTGRLMEYRQLITDPATRDAWQLSAANEFGRLAQGVGGRIKEPIPSRSSTTTKCPTIAKPHTHALSVQNDPKNRNATAHV